MFSHSACTGGNWGNSKWKGGRSDWHSWFVPNVGFSRRFSSHWQLSSGGQWSDPQTLEIPRMPAVETQGLVWPVDYCLSGSMTTSAFTLRVDTVSWAAMISYQCMCGSFCPHWRIFWKILAVPTSHCPTWGEKSKVFPPKLPFLPPPPAASGCMNSGLPLFQFNRGQRAERRGLLSHTESNNSLTDNVTHNVRQSEDRKGAATGLSESALRTTRLRKSRPRYLKCLSKGVTASVWNHWS